MRPEARIAFVTDILPVIGGAEKTLFAALECFPNAEVFTLIYNKQAFVHTPLGKRKILISHLDKFPFIRSHYKLFLPLMPHAIEQFDLEGYDIVVSFNYAVANGVNAKGAKHFSYTHTPMRYAWSDLNIDGKKTRNSFPIDQYLRSFRRWDKAAASRIHKFGAISNGTAQRVWSAYGRKAEVIYPPVEVDRFHPEERRGRYYVVLSRLVAHKRVELIVEAFSRLNLPLKIIGDGPEGPRLQRLASGNIEFLGFQSDACVAEILSRARGFVCAAEEDFGIAMVEAQAAGCPVIAHGKGGALETVIENRTGLFFKEPAVEDVSNAVEYFEQRASTFDRNDLLVNARRFDKSVFLEKFKSFIDDREDQSRDLLCLKFEPRSSDFCSSVAGFEKRW
jgi:glycosyltransferase involved in cell wall biosynthesis